VCLALALFVARVLADDHDATVATNDLALVTNLLDAWINLHVSFSVRGFKNRFTCIYR
jgi:DeoR/GlpR family transcriptional regulator of sugar metabolism